jgi:hypothetical protein
LFTAEFQLTPITKVQEICWRAASAMQFLSLGTGLNQSLQLPHPGLLHAWSLAHHSPKPEQHPANQHIMVSEISTEDVPEIKRILAKYKLDGLNHTGLRLSSSACVAFPTCGK